MRDIKINKKTVRAIEVPLPNAFLILAAAPKGFVMCGYLDITAAEKFGDCAAVVRGVKTIDDLLSARIVAVTSAAEKKGIRPGMTGRRALAKML